MTSIVIACTKSWNIHEARVFKKKNKGKYNVFLITKPEDLLFDKLKKIKPSFIFFPHWSWIIPEEIWGQFPCVVFHMTDLPFGRGGSPLQNLLVRGIHTTKISALQVDKGLDTGPIYLKKSISIRRGSAEEIFRSISSIIFSSMMPQILQKKMIPRAQHGKAVNFKRRKPSESNILDASLHSTNQVYDFIRMLDGEGYPQAFIGIGNKLKMTFQNAKKKNGTITGSFTVTKEDHE